MNFDGWELKPEDWANLHVQIRSAVTVAIPVNMHIFTWLFSSGKPDEQGLMARPCYNR